MSSTWARCDWCGDWMVHAVAAKEHLARCAKAPWREEVALAHQRLQDEALRAVKATARANRLETNLVNEVALRIEAEISRHWYFDRWMTANRLLPQLGRVVSEHLEMHKRLQKLELSLSRYHEQARTIIAQEVART